MKCKEKLSSSFPYYDRVVIVNSTAYIAGDYIDRNDHFNQILQLRIDDERRSMNIGTDVGWYSIAR